MYQKFTDVENQYDNGESGLSLKQPVTTMVMTVDTKQSDSRVIDKKARLDYTCFLFPLLVLRVFCYFGIMLSGFFLVRYVHCDNGNPSVTSIIVLQSMFSIYYLFDEVLLLVCLSPKDGKLSQYGMNVRNVSLTVNIVSKIVICVLGLYVVIGFNRQYLSTDGVLIYVIVVCILFLCFSVMLLRNFYFGNGRDMKI